MALFDYCVITAPTSRQAAEFRRMIQKRLERGLYPREIAFKVFSDPDQGRVGSGGGTLLALRGLLDESGEGDPDAFYRNKRVLIIHAGGESRRLPCYVPEGKLFAPIPVDSSSVIPPVVLDMQLTLFLKYPWRKGEVVVTSGDVIIDFDTEALPDDRGEICGFATAASLEQGSRHGVFKFDRFRRDVESFYQKAPVEFLAEHAALEGTRECALDMGIVSLGPRAVSAFFRIGEIADDGTTLLGSIAEGKARFDLYLEVMTAALKGLTFESFQKRVTPESTLSRNTLKQLFTIANELGLTAVLTRATHFLHMGSLGDFLHSCMALRNRGLTPFYALEVDELRAICTPELLVHNCVNLNIPLGRHKTVFAEGVSSCTLENLLGSNMLFGISDWSSDATIPEGLCIDQRETEPGTVRLVYGMHDTFKPQQSPERVIFCGIPLSQWLEQRGLTSADLWDSGAPADLLSARLFCPGVSDEFLSGYWSVPLGKQWAEKFRASARVSIRQVNDGDCMETRESRRMTIRAQQLRELVGSESGWVSVSLPDFTSTFGSKGDFGALEQLYQKTDDSLLKAYRHRLLSAIHHDTDSELEAPSFDISYVEPVEPGHPLSVAVKEDQIVWARSPVRLDIAGGWSDTPPYTLLHGGAVVNLAVDLNGQPPVQVFCRRTPDLHVRIHSIDLGVTETITTIQSLVDYRNPVSPFALPRAALCLLGFSHDQAPSLANQLKALGCGIEMTLLCAVPKGSGLGTSSILGATILGALHRFFGKPVDRSALFRQVLQVEQMLTTGGGWQDQIGGVEGGVKYIESRPGLRPNPVVHQLEGTLFSAPATHGCFTLFYTGITRLARNILREVVDQVNARTAAYHFTLNHVRRLAEDARRAIGLHDLAALSEIVSLSWDANVRIHPSTTNDQVERMLARTRAFYLGVKLLGAGGGGYALFVSESVEQAMQLRNVLRAEFENERARIVEFNLNRTGMQVTVS